MSTLSATLPLALVYIMMLGWCGFAMIFIFRKRLPSTRIRKMDRRSIIGIGLQSVAYFLVWSIRRPFPSSLLGINPIADIAVALLAIALIVFSLWLVASAVRTLGKQWSLAARVVEDHQLIIDGPYRLVRHPIYTGMGGMLIATGLAISHPAAIVFGLIVFAIGTFNRIRIEEHLLTEQFGSAYAAYAAKVPALIPKPWRK